jgi:hypothetical protein
VMFELVVVVGVGLLLGVGVYLMLALPEDE